jgi:hypothetical protein
MSEEEKKREKHEQMDPISGEPVSHDAGTAIGSAAAGLAGAGIGMAVGGPVGATIGAVVGAVIGGGVGHAMAEKIDPAAEHAYWKEHHERQPYAEGDTTYDFEHYQLAYRTGWEGYRRFGPGKKFDDMADLLKEWYEQHSSPEDVPWEKACPAVQAAYERVQDRLEIPQAKEDEKEKR